MFHASTEGVAFEVALSGFLGSTAILGSVSDQMIRRLRRWRPSVHPTVPLFQETFSNS
jgi:hypothetical protein